MGTPAPPACLLEPPPQLRDPASALHTIHRRTRLRPGTVLVTLFGDPGDRQRLLGTVRVWDSPVDTPDRRQFRVRGDHAVRLLAGQDVPTSTQTAAAQDAGASAGAARLVVVVARHGPVIFRASDLGWALALIRPDGAAVASSVGPPELLLVTEHGFRCWSDATGARHPALRRARAR